MAETRYWLARLARVEEQLNQAISELCDQVSSRDTPTADSGAYVAGEISGMLYARDKVRAVRRDWAATEARQR